MSPDEIRQHLRHGTPALICMNSGESFLIPRPDFAIVSPSGDGVIVYHPKKGTFLRHLSTRSVATIRKAPRRGT